MVEAGEPLHAEGARTDQNRVDVRAQTDRAWILNELPASAAAAHMTMTLAGVRADGGYLVAGDHPYILVLFALGADEATIERALAQASAAIYRATGGR